METQTAIHARFNGPPTSGNGGYSCGILAAHVAGCARVRLHVPPPLDTPLQVKQTDNGAAALYDGDTLVATAVSGELKLSPPAAPSLTEAEAAMKQFPCYEHHNFPTCFVCGPGRPAHDGLGLFPGPVAERNVYACIWHPAPDLLDDEQNIRPEFLWAALDCPGYFAAMGSELRTALLGELVGELYTSVAGGQPLIVYAWPLGVDGRKFYAGTAIATTDGTLVASAKSTWILLKV